MATTLSRSDMAKGGRNGSRKGIPNRKTIARRLVEGLAEAGSGEATLTTIQEILDGKHGNPLRLEVAKMVIQSGLDTTSAAEIARLKAQLRQQELTLQQVLKHSTQRQAVELLGKLEKAARGEIDDINDDEEQDK
ncbi:hypothetical protein [Shewanella algae]|uniref:hypothetical protein n=1 Tax=Shewanella algae TaxID=38313 RepID=UPI003AADBE2F